MLKIRVGLSECLLVYTGPHVTKIYGTISIEKKDEGIHIKIRYENGRTNILVMEWHGIGIDVSKSKKKKEVKIRAEKRPLLTTGVILLRSIGVANRIRGPSVKIGKGSNTAGPTARGLRRLLIP